MFSAVTTQHSEPYRSSKSTSDSKAISLDSSATRLVSKIDFCSLGPPGRGSARSRGDAPVPGPGPPARRHRHWQAWHARGPAAHTRAQTDRTTTWTLDPKPTRQTLRLGIIRRTGTQPPPPPPKAVARAAQKRRRLGGHRLRACERRTAPLTRASYTLTRSLRSTFRATLKVGTRPRSALPVIVRSALDSESQQQRELSSGTTRAAGALRHYEVPRCPDARGVGHAVGSFVAGTVWAERHVMVDQACHADPNRANAAAERGAEVNPGNQANTKHSECQYLAPAGHKGRSSRAPASPPAAALAPQRPPPEISDRAALRRLGTDGRRS